MSFHFHGRRASENLISDLVKSLTMFYKNAVSFQLTLQKMLIVHTEYGFHKHLHHRREAPNQHVEAKSWARQSVETSGSERSIVKFTREIRTIGLPHREFRSLLFGEVLKYREAKCGSLRVEVLNGIVTLSESDLGRGSRNHNSTGNITRAMVSYLRPSQINP
ncbi:hypothetical protein DL98DRAFT_530005 [Cadophora sp. DSE1049]|nr:hypothetical protein DL98DRAFT_530005 [Cadophora sp. DSE1049]